MLENIKLPGTWDMQSPGLLNITLHLSNFAMYGTQISLDRWVQSLAKKHVVFTISSRRALRPV